MQKHIFWWKLLFSILFAELQGNNKEVSVTATSKASSGHNSAD